MFQNIFKHLDVDNKGEIPIDELLSLYNPQQSLEYLKQKKTEDEAMRIFEESLRGNHKYLNGDEGDTKPVDNEEFEDFYESVSMMIPSDELFRDVILRTWGLIKDEPREEENEEEPQENEDVQDNRRPPREEYDEESRENPQEDRHYQEEMEPEPEQEEEYEERPPVKKLRDKEKEFRKNILNEENIDLFRDKLGARGIVTVMNFANSLRQYDRKGDKNIKLVKSDTTIILRFWGQDGPLYEEEKDSLFRLIMNLNKE